MESIQWYYERLKQRRRDLIGGALLPYRKGGDIWADPTKGSRASMLRLATRVAFRSHKGILSGGDGIDEGARADPVKGT